MPASLDYVSVVQPLYVQTVYSFKCFRHFMTYASFLPSVRLVSAQLFGQLISVSRYRLIKFKRRLVEKIH